MDHALLLRACNRIVGCEEVAHEYSAKTLQSLGQELAVAGLSALVINPIHSCIHPDSRLFFKETGFGLIDVQAWASKQLGENRFLSRFVALCYPGLEAMQSGLRNVQLKHLAKAPFDLHHILTECHVLIDYPVHQTIAITGCSLRIPRRTEGVSA